MAHRFSSASIGRIYLDQATLDSIERENDFDISSMNRESGEILNSDEASNSNRRKRVRVSASGHAHVHDPVHDTVRDPCHERDIQQSVDLANHRLTNLQAKLKDLKDDITELNHQIDEVKAEKEMLIIEHKNVMNELDNIKDLKTTCLDQINNLFSEVNNKIREITNPLENNVRTIMSTCQNVIQGRLIPELQKIEKMGIDKCKICLSEDIDVCFVPCGHTSCAGCAIKMDNCHMCRAFINETQNIYI